MQRTVIGTMPSLSPKHIHFHSSQMHNYNAPHETDKASRLTANYRTDFTQQAKVTSFVHGASNKIEDFILKQFKDNATKGREIMESAIQRVEQEHLAFAAAAQAAFL